MGCPRETNKRTEMKLLFGPSVGECRGGNEYTWVEESRKRLYSMKEEYNWQIFIMMGRFVHFFPSFTSIHLFLYTLISEWMVHHFAYFFLAFYHFNHKFSSCMNTPLIFQVRLIFIFFIIYLLDSCLLSQVRKEEFIAFFWSPHLLARYQEPPRDD